MPFYFIMVLPDICQKSTVPVIGTAAKKNAWSNMPSYLGCCGSGNNIEQGVYREWKRRPDREIM